MILIFLVGIQGGCSHEREMVFGFAVMKVTMPVDSPVFAIRKDGSIHSVRCSDEQISAISPGGGIYDAAFVEDTLKPALGLQVN